MNYKERNLYNKIYSSFIKGVYGNPIIPSKSEVLKKMDELTTSEYRPISSISKMDDVDIEHIQKNFSNVIDDIDILFSSVESESRDILDQLTDSLKEHNGSKRELKRLKGRVSDIQEGRLGEEYLEYNYTENFHDLNEINTHRSCPVNTDAGVFTIRKGAENIVSLRHYAGSKIEFNVVENYSNIIEKGYAGTTDAATMLDQQDPRQIVYKIVTNKPTRLRTTFTLQLLPDGKPVDINAVTLDVDSSVSKGSVRLYYQDYFKWVDVKQDSIKEIKNDKVNFIFPDISTSHIKIEFIKDFPDIAETNTYRYVINNIVVSKATTRNKAVLYSTPIVVSKYSNEVPVVSNIQASAKYSIPKDCDVKLYVSSDIKISGEFLDNDGQIVDSTSPNVSGFDATYSGYVFLSELWDADNTISGVAQYKGVDYNWRPIQFKDGAGENVPSIIEFNNTVKSEKIDNSLFNIHSYALFGDNDYESVYAISGWVNTDNSGSWATMSDLVDSGILVSGVDVATIEGVAWDDIEDMDGNLHPDITGSLLYSGQWVGYNSGVGYPFNYTNPTTGNTITFGQYDRATNGWWRPYSNYVTPTGVNNSIEDNDVQYSKPDFYFNNIPFYKIYKINYNDTVIDSSIKLFTYQEKPVTSDASYYPINFIWNYKEGWIDAVGSQTNVSHSDFEGSDWTDYVLPLATLEENEEYVVDGISDIKIRGTSVVLDESEYKDQITSTGIKLDNLNDTRANLSPTDLTFDYKYRYRIKNDYLSSWTGYAIVSPGVSSPTMIIENQKVSGERNISVIKDIIITNLQNDTTKTISASDDSFSIVFDLDPSIVGDQNFKIIIHCASDSSTGFSASNWIPRESISSVNGTLVVDPYIKLVSKISPISMVDLSTLIYDTPMNNDDRAAIVSNYLGEKYIIAKSPSKDVFPGYYFNSLTKSYVLNDISRVKNIGHWVREGHVVESGNGAYNIIGPFRYTTGSNNSGIVYKIDRDTIDTTWNDGGTLPDFPNYTGVNFYNHHSTYGHPLNVDISNDHNYSLYAGDCDPRANYASGIVGSSNWTTWNDNSTYSGNVEELASNGVVSVTDTNKGFLYYATGENLPAYYSVSYRKVLSEDDTNNRFLYKLELSSNDEGSLVPTVESLTFKVNRNI